MKDYEKPMMEIIDINNDVITDSDVNGEEFCLFGDDTNP